MHVKRKRFSSGEEIASKKAKSEDDVMEISESQNSSTIKEIENFFKKYLHAQLRANRKFSEKIKKKVFKLENDNIKQKSKIIDLENDNFTLRDEKEKLTNERDGLKIQLENETTEIGELAENIKSLQMKLQETENKAIELEIVREKQLLELMQKNDQLFEENKRFI